MLAKAVAAHWEHIDPVASNMRDADALEVWLAAHKTPHEALREGFAASVRAWTIMRDGEPIGMFGVSSASVLGNIGVPWLLGTDGMLKVKRQFVKECGHYIDWMLSLYPHLVNYVHADNKPSIRMIKWLGFELEGPRPAGPEGADFFKFERFRDV